ncbi:molybdenum cofactor guanylyltransferase [Brevibacillus choshinensis]|uniref:Probable molybdenum cofactor guanylyltransferase n=1 Tax=Brevibacillus choshinensis TaxID=54911 RepID=A0ABX7FSI7_BRECH|nr:molybdenum cofactor guanylyltransferase [Brevibacillus choshinensis]QRG68705.1 molybdenum cofactor guanylyltransferase [Brevibacillus choshinensis]
MNKQTMRAVILAGGNSSRMGTPKELLKWRKGTFLSELVREVTKLELSCLVVSNRPERLAAELIGEANVRVTADLVPSAGPVSGMVTAFRATEEEVLLVLSCDLPFMDHKEIQKLCEYANGWTDWDVVAARAQGRLHPLCALYHRRTQPVWERALHDGQYRLMHTLAQLDVRVTPEGLLDEWAVFNANTPEDYQTALTRESNRNERPH